MSTGSIGDIVAQLRAAQDQLAASAVTAGRAQADALEALSRYTEAGRGSEHPEIKAAISEIQIAGAKSDKVARLINEIRQHIIDYANHIAPGAVSPAATPSAMPTGEQLVQDAARRSNAFGKGARAVANNAEKAGNAGKKIIDFLQEARPKGTTATSQPSGTPPTAPQHGTGNFGDAASAVIVGGAIVIAAGLKALDARRKKNEETRDSPDSPS
nr:hypothetical protein [Micromonospora sp. DSM 115978]